MGLERGPLGVVKLNVEYLERKSSGAGLKKTEINALTTRHPSIGKSWH
jgi:hypothetical protein